MHATITPSLRKVRLEHGLTQPELSHRSGVSCAVISRIERGGGARVETLAKLSQVLGVTFTIGSSRVRRSQK